MASRPIYGSTQTAISDTFCLSLPSFTTLRTLITTITTLVEQFYPEGKVLAPQVVTMEARANISPALFIRLEWRQANPGIVFTSSQQQIYQIVDLYISHGLDPTKDPLYKLYVPPS
jgi:hypothetical protein